MNRKKHLEWCEKRALEYLDAGDMANAVTSMMSDLDKHPDTELKPDGAMSMLGMTALMSGDPDFVRRFITGFN